MVEIEEMDDPHHHDKDEDASSRSNIQLGFSEPISDEEGEDSRDPYWIGHRSPKWWKDWDGGQLGGRPSWLQPRDIPRVTCKSCDSPNPLHFICQLYVPLDHQPQAYHRSFYVFACPNCCCRSSSTTDGSVVGNGIRVLRVQLPLNNPFYPPENVDPVVCSNWTQHLPLTHGIHPCQVCGQRAMGKCPKQQVWFCGKIHQKEYKKYSSSNTTSKAVMAATNGTMDTTKKNAEEQTPELLVGDDALQQIPTEAAGNPPYDNSHSPSFFLPSVYMESEIVVDYELPAGEDADQEDDDDDDDDDDEIEKRPTLFPSTPGNKDGHDSDEDIEQEDLNEMLTGTKLDRTSVKDPLTDAFYKRIQSRQAPDQCLRYCMDWRRRYDRTDKDHDKDATLADNPSANDSQPLWIRSDHRPSDIPSCPYCGASRAFEFQLMPQMLHFLQQQRQQQQQDSPPTALADKKETAKRAVITAQSIITNSDPSQIPPSFVDAKAKAMQALEQDLFRNNVPTVEWGIVAIYTCTASCSGGERAHNSDCDPQLGPAYLEEYAWLQPAPDV